MIKHVVMIRLQDYAEGADKEENLRKIKHIFNTLKNNVKMIQDLEVGFNYFNNPRAADLVLTVTFDTREDLESYRTHPEHLKAGDFIHRVRQDAWVVDYEI